MADVIYNSFKKNVLTGNLKLDTDTIKVMLVKSSYVPDQDLHAARASVDAFEISGPGYTAGGNTLEKLVISQDDVKNQAVFDAADVVWPASTLTARYAVLYKDTGTPTTSPLICCFDFGSDKSSVNHDFVIQWNVDGIVNLG